MPQYTFYCEPCNLEFKKKLSMGEHPKHKCPACRGDAGRHMEGFGFDFAPAAGTAQANSGVSKHDYPTADNIVGRSAEERWQIMDARNKAKRKLRTETGAVALSRKDFVGKDGQVSEYTTLGQTQFDARKQLEGDFKKTAKKIGLEQPSRGMPKKMEAPR
jgi:putative FmdB family regulatory protein